MKNLFFGLVALISLSCAQAQQDPVSWKFSATKIADKTFEVTMVAEMKAGWHIYAQAQPKDAIAYPTKFDFTNNPLVTRTGAVKELGKLQKFKDPSLGLTAHQYGNKVSFVQKVVLKVNAKTSLAGTVEYQTCDDKKCLPPKKVPFNIPIG